MTIKLVPGYPHDQPTLLQLPPAGARYIRIFRIQSEPVMRTSSLIGFEKNGLHQVVNDLGMCHSIRVPPNHWFFRTKMIIFCGDPF